MTSAELVGYLDSELSAVADETVKPSQHANSS